MFCIEPAVYKLGQAGMMLRGLLRHGLGAWRVCPMEGGFLLVSAGVAPRFFSYGARRESKDGFISSKAKGGRDGGRDGYGLGGKSHGYIHHGHTKTVTGGVRERRSRGLGSVDEVRAANDDVEDTVAEDDAPADEAVRSAAVEEIVDAAAAVQQGVEELPAPSTARVRMLGLDDVDCEAMYLAACERYPDLASLTDRALSVRIERVSEILLQPAAKAALAYKLRVTPEELAKFDAAAAKASEEKAAAVAAAAAAKAKAAEEAKAASEAAVKAKEGGAEVDAAAAKKQSRKPQTEREVHEYARAHPLIALAIFAEPVVLRRSVLSAVPELLSRVLPELDASAVIGRAPALLAGDARKMEENVKTLERVRIPPAR